MSWSGRRTKQEWGVFCFLFECRMDGLGKGDLEMEDPAQLMDMGLEGDGKRDIYQ
jgi:hypothetical protein